ncbi:MAG: hypothetical protein IJY04_04490, partial [Clostridia bacterium]|nr:hypothetical protein [Clostridia bacterium]
MLIDFSKVSDRRSEPPMLRLQTLAGAELGIISDAYNIEAEIMLSELSTIRFEVPKQKNGVISKLYSQISSYKVVYTENYGIYVLTSPVTSGDGMQEVKTVTGYSLEKLFERKRLILAEGTYRFYDDAQPEETILGRVAALNPSWHIGYVAPELKNVYRTFDQYDNDALSFCYGDAMNKFNCVIVFDVYEKSINAWLAAEAQGVLPVYLSYDNLIEEAEVEEITDNIVTKLYPYGSDELTIREVNPIGGEYIVDLSYFIHNGDLDIVPEGSSVKLSDRVQSWQKLVLEQQPYYTGLVAAYSAKTSEKLFEENKLAELKGELETLTVQQSVTIQALALEITTEGRVNRQAELAQLTAQITSKKAEIVQQKAYIADITDRMVEIYTQLEVVNDELAMENYFSENEMLVLEQFLIEGELSDETFVAAETDLAAVPSTATLSGGSIKADGAEVQRIELENGAINMYAIVGGSLNIAEAQISGRIARATFEQRGGEKSFLFTAYLGETSFETKKYEGGLVTVSGKYSSISSDVSSRNEDGLILDKGTRIDIEPGEANLFFTASMSEYQKLSVVQDLYEFGMEAMESLAWPVYEFSLNSANFIYHSSFKPFKDKLELGKGIYLNLGEETIIQANLIGVSLNFDDPTSFGLIFSNQFQRKNGAETLRTAIKEASMSSRSFDLSKYTYNKTVAQQSKVSEYMNSMLDAAVNNILAASNQSVVIDGAGIHVGGDSKYQLRIVDNMIAMTDDGWQSAELALGRFASDEIGVVWGVNTELLAGKISIAETLIIEAESDTGVKQFRVDPSGAWLYNATFVLQSDDGGKILIDPSHGIAAGTSDLFTFDGTTVTPLFLDEDGEIIPENVSFFLNLQDGSAYFNGVIKAEDFLNSKGESMLSGDKINAEYLDLSGVEGDISHMETVFTVELGKIEGKVSEVQQTAKAYTDDKTDELKKTITTTLTNYSTITQTAESIETAVTSAKTTMQEYTDGQISELTTHVEENYSTITQTA